MAAMKATFIEDTQILVKEIMYKKYSKKHFGLVDMGRGNIC